MPYANNQDLPAAVRDALPDAAQSVFRNVFNSQSERGLGEERAFASAWAAVKRGWEKGKDGEWARIAKADYQGQQVELDKPFRLPSGHNKKFGVYVKDGEKVKRVTFGDPNMEIRRDDPEARASFRARHKCDTQTDKTTAAYWSCRMWESDVTVSESTEKFQIAEDAQVLKVDDSLGLVFGWAMVCQVDGEDYYDSQNDHIPEDAMTKALLDFAEVRVAKEMHSGEQIGTFPFLFPMTSDIAKSLGMTTRTTGALIAMKPDSADTLAKFRDGTWTGFSIGGARLHDEVVSDG